MVLACDEMNLTNFSEWLFLKCWVAGLYNQVTLFVITSTVQPHLGTVHYLLGVRDRCFGVWDKDFFECFRVRDTKIFCVFMVRDMNFFWKKSNYICIISRGGNSHRLGYEMCHF